MGHFSWRGQLDLVARQMRGQLLVPRRLGLLQLPPHQIFLDDLLGFDRRVGDAVLHRRVVAEVEMHLARAFGEPFATMTGQTQQELGDHQLQRFDFLLKLLARILQFAE